MGQHLVHLCAMLVVEALGFQEPFAMHISIPIQEVYEDFKGRKCSIGKT